MDILMKLAIFCILFVILWGVLKLCIEHRYSYWKLKNVFCFNASFPWGNARNIITVKQSFSELFTDVYFQIKAANEREAGFFFIFTPQYVPVDLDIIKSILVKDFAHFTDRGVYYNERDDPLSAHLFTLEGQKWKFLRDKISPTFTTGKLKRMFNAIVEVASRLIDLLKEDEIDEGMEMKELMARYTTDIIGTCAFGIDCNTMNDPDTEFMQHGRNIFKETRWQKFVNFLTFVMPDLMKFFRVRQLPKEPTDFFFRVIKDTIELRERQKIRRDDFMDLLIQLKRTGTLEQDDDDTQQSNSPSRGTEQSPANARQRRRNRIQQGVNTNTFRTPATTLTLEQIAGQSFVFFVAGFETSSSTMSFCLYELGCNIEIQEKLREEIKTQLEEHGGELTYETVASMTYMDMVLRETLRKYPSLPILNRICTKTYTVPQTGTVIEKGTQVIIPVGGLHYDPTYFPNPHEFDPERFNDENKGNRPALCYLPFGDGPRICVGMRFGQLQTKVILAMLLSEFRFRVNHKTPIPVVVDRTKFLNTAVGGIWMDIYNL